MKQKDKTIINGLTFILTSVGCPEQYEIFKDENQVGYVRIRSGWFRIDYPKHKYEKGSKTIFEKQVSVNMLKGQFNRSERAYYLKLTADLINYRLEKYEQQTISNKTY